ncbi:XRE family transcriptional regulator [Streptomyces sanyensis]|uniref:XRE family transcriptional regulator n=1 Tax=Streptomyces sanyensis TaxID=568869 RepID=A0ABP8ZRM8_9ACTN
MSQVNRKLEARMGELGLKQAELAHRVNVEIELLTGRPGCVTDADVRRWLRGRTRWPQDRIRLSLERVLSSGAEDLGFVPRGKVRVPLEEDSVRRRKFLSGASGSVLAVGVSGIGDHGRVDVGDVRRLRQEYMTILRADHEGRGPRHVECRAVELASRIRTALARSTASARVRDMLHRLAAEVISAAAFASLDASRPLRARAHLGKALAFAGLSRDGEAVYHVWNHMFLASSQQENHAEAIAGADVMKRSSIARRDPLYLSLGHLRHANGLARVGRRSEALRALGDAERAFARSEEKRRSEWIGFYDTGEFEALSAFVWAALGEFGRAEYRLHRTLALLPEGMARNRALYTAHLAWVQARQNEPELACATSRQARLSVSSACGSRRTARTLDATRSVLLASGTKSPRVIEWIEESGAWT